MDIFEGTSIKCKYNITNGQSTPIEDPSAPIYIAIGDVGNSEGIVNKLDFYSFLSRFFIWCEENSY